MSGNNNPRRNHTRGANKNANHNNFNPPRGPPGTTNPPPVASGSNATTGMSPPRGPAPNPNANEFNPRGRFESVSGFAVKTTSSGSQAPHSPSRAAPNAPNVSYNSARELPNDL